MINTTGHTYFAIKTENEATDLETFNNYLSIQPTKFQKKFERGKVPVTTSWQLSSGDLTNPDYFEEIEKLITKLNKHKTELLKIKKENPEIEFVLEVVIYLGDESPGLNFSQETIAFINDIGGTIDCDIYNATPRASRITPPSVENYWT